eukprot:4363829-Pyramimonas_sp.AAC.1
MRTIKGARKGATRPRGGHGAICRILLKRETSIDDQILVLANRLREKWVRQRSAVCAERSRILCKQPTADQVKQDIQGCTVFVHDSVGVDRDRVFGLVRSLGMVVRHAPENARAFIVSDCARPPPHVLWHSMMRGCRIGTVEWVDSLVQDRSVGPCLVYKSARASRRLVWPST